ncbi:MAG: GPW/gp25 family protein [Sphingobacteriaceae bacterium]|nr:GPW/gp25 family protein [Cytophagaceae bacterium]
MNTPFLGRGWNFPPQFDRATAQVTMLEGEADIRSSLHVLLSTLPGERVMQPDYGCDLTPLLFQPVDTALRTFLQDRIRTAVLSYEPRITVDRVDLEPDPNEGRILITLDYTVRTTNSRQNLVFPFHQTEGTETPR